MELNMLKVMISSIVLLMIFLLNMEAVDFQIEKIDEFSIGSYLVYRSPGKTILTDYPYVYTLTGYGLEIYSISTEGSLSLISRTQVIACWNLEKIDDYVFIGTNPRHHDPFNAVIYKIDISDPYNPVIVQKLGFDDTVTRIDDLIKINDYLLVRTLTNPWGPIFPILNTDLETVQLNPVTSIPLLLYGDNLLLTEVTGGGGYQIYDFSDLENITLIGSGDISGVHYYNIWFKSAYQDTVLVFGNQREISFWDVSDPDDWQLLYNIDYINDPDLIIYGTPHIIDHYLVYLNIYNIVVMDLNDYTIDLISGDHPFLERVIHSDTWQGNIYFTTQTMGIIHLLYDGDFSYIDFYCDIAYNSNVHFYENYCLVRPLVPYSYDVVVYDISNPHAIVEINRFFEESPKLFYSGVNELAYFRDYAGFTYGNIEIYDISDPLNPYLRNTIDLSPWFSQPVWLISDQTEPYVLYVYLQQQRKMLKFDISVENETELLLEMDLPASTYDGRSNTVHNGYLYNLVRRGNTNWYDLNIYSSLLDNEPVLQNTINHFVTNDFAPHLKIVDNYLSVFIGSTGTDNTFFYSLADSSQPALAFHHGESGIPFIHEELLFQSPGNAVFIYDLTGFVSGEITPVTYFLSSGMVYHYYFQEAGDISYLYSVSSLSIAVYEYSYETGIEDDIAIPVEETYLSRNYPNPFNPETNISFYLEQEKRVKLEIFNIRGQKLATLIDDILPEGEHSLVWSPQSHRGRDLPSGVYLYRLQAGDYAETRKMLYLK